MPTTSPLTLPHTLLLLLASTMIGYDPKTSKAIPNYVVKTTGDRFFIPAYPEPHAKAGDLAQCKKLSPLGVEVVAA